MNNTGTYKITIAGAGYVGMSMAVLLGRRHDVTVLDIDKTRIDMINNRVSPVSDDLIEEYLAKYPLHIHACTDVREACAGADLVIVAVPTDFDETTGSLNTKTVGNVVRTVHDAEKEALIVIKSTVPAGFTARLRQEQKIEKILFCPEFLRESKASVWIRGWGIITTIRLSDMEAIVCRRIPCSSFMITGTFRRS